MGWESMLPLFIVTGTPHLSSLLHTPLDCILSGTERLGLLKVVPAAGFGRLWLAVNIGLNRSRLEKVIPTSFYTKPIFAGA